MGIKIRKSELENGTYHLMAEGGEAKIFEFDSKTLMKIFKDHVMLDLKEQKVLAWLKATKMPFVVSPIEDVRVANKFAGYTLKKVENASPIGTLAKKKYIKLTGFTNKDVLEILLDYSKKMERIHKEGKCIGDINEQNVLLKGKDLYYIDTDSFGIDALPADAYTEIYTDPNAYQYKGKNLIRVELNEKTDMFAFAILCFKLLTRIHPFNGTYEKDPDMDTKTRIEKHISVLGKYEIKIPPMIESWAWMSPKLLDSFLAIFEKGERKYITNELEELLSHMKFCDKHQMYYYSKYSDCPICNENAKVSVMPSIVQNNVAKGLSIKTIFTAKEVNYFFDFSKYLSNNFNFVHLKSGNTWKASNEYRVEFSEDGKYAFEVYDSEILVYHASTKNFMFKIYKTYKSSVYIVDKFIYYIDETLKLCRSEIKPTGNFYEPLLPVYVNTIFAANSKDYLAILLYDKKMLITSKNYSIFLNYNDKITEYAIKYDDVTKNWLFIYETRNGGHRTVVISPKGEVIFDSTIYRYSATSLNNICFANNTIFSPSSEKIVGINYAQNRVKNFECHVVNEESVLRFRNGGFDILSENTLYRFGA
ncbi:MAG: hypothetical protein Q4D02_07200 [Clostridia bacterium]|nr:hypothetical protein [Clostridia bacterium]